MLCAAMGLCAATGVAVPADGADARPWLDPARDPDARAALAVQAMTQDEKFTLIEGFYATTRPGRYTAPPQSRPASAGYVPGIERLGIPSQWETDAGIGVASQSSADTVRERTALPSGLATAATWNPEIAFQGGAMIGAEARASGFNVMLAGGVNLLRDPRNGRNFEYGGEDPLLAGMMVGAEVRGIQSNHIVSTVKHYALNDQETGRTSLNVELDDAAARLSDLLAFQIAIEQGRPGAVMCSYNRVHGVYACENDALLNGVLKHDFHFPGYVMSDWGAQHSAAEAANAGLDQESAGRVFDRRPYFDADLRAALAGGAFTVARLDDMVRRILRSLFAVGAVDHPVAESAIDFAAHARVTQDDAEEAIVLLRNRAGLLPLSPTLRRVTLIGSHADIGVLSGGGSGQVHPVGGPALPGLGPRPFPGPTIYDPSSPLEAIAARLPGSQVRFASGEDRAEALRLAADSDVVLLFAHQWTAESRDFSLTLPDNQDSLIAALAQVNPRTVVVLETGGPVLMPWLGQVGAVLEAWYPGSSGAEALARVLCGDVDASGRLPVSFPKDESQLPRPQLDGLLFAPDSPFAVHYREGAAVGYKWFDLNHLEPLFAFGYGLSYGTVEYSALSAQMDGQRLRVRFGVRNSSRRAVRDTPQVYVGADDGVFEAPRRLAGWRKLSLAP
ncbi:MAG TPA: glycoside hydrolase family 3 protein, partial [Steroidobacteraceae bacterium]|nr:glycoside hydrolase family 3 protein [Steroidobacteraceae bacterium]